MKNKTFFYVILLLILLLPSQYLMFKSPLYPSIDALFHIERIQEFNLSLQNHQVPPRLAPTIEGAIGYPLFVVNYQTPYFLAQIPLLIFQNKILAFKTVMSISFLLSGLFALLLFKKIGSNLAALTGALIFAYAPYRFANLYTRGALGESISFVFVPLILLAMHYVEGRKNRLAFFLLAVSIFGLITSHTVIFMVFAPLIFLYPIVVLKVAKETLIKILAAFLVGVGLSSFQLFPSILEKHIMNFDQNLIGLYQGHFLDFSQIFRIPKVGINLGSPFQVGVACTFVIIISAIYALKRQNRQILFFLALAVFSIFITLKMSALLWDNVPVLSYVLYPWRFLGLLVVSTSFLAVYTVNQHKLKTVLAAFLILLAIYTSRHYFLRPTQLVSNPPTSNLTTENEFNTVYSNEKTFKNRPLITSTPTTQISNLKATPFRVSFDMVSEKPTEVIIRKLYFPTWQIEVNAQKYPVGQKDGLLSLNLPSGTWSIVASFKESAIRRAGNFASLLFFLGLIAFTIFKREKKTPFPGSFLKTSTGQYLN